MTTAILELDPATDIKRFSPADTAIAAMAQEYLPLTIAGMDDRDGFKAVHDARMVVKSHRVNVEKTRKALKADALEYGRTVDAEAKRLTAMLEPIESHLKAEEDAYSEAHEEIKRKKTQERIDKLAAVGVSYLVHAVEMMTDSDFDELLASKTAEFKAQKEEADRLAKERAQQEAEEAAKRKAEQEKMEAERAAIEAERRQLAAKQKEEADRLAKERAAIEEQRIAQQKEQARLDEQKRQAELEQARKEAAEQARIAEIKRKEEEDKALVAKAARDAEEAARQEALRPDREKLLSVRDAILAIEVPEVAGELAGEREAIQGVLLHAADRILTFFAN